MKVKNYRCEGAGPVPGGQLSVLPDWRVLSTCACCCSFVRSFIPRTLPSAAPKVRLESWPRFQRHWESACLCGGFKAL